MKDQRDKKERYRPVSQNLIAAFGQRLKCIVLFGSQARSKHVLERDHDIFVVVANLPQNPLHRLKEIRKTILDIPLQINFVAKTPQEVDANLTPLLLEICVDGICLHGEEYFEEYRKRALNALQQSGLQRKRLGKEWYWQFPKAPQKDWELTWDGFYELS